MHPERRGRRGGRAGVGGLGEQVQRRLQVVGLDEFLAEQKRRLRREFGVATGRGPTVEVQEIVMPIPGPVHQRQLAEHLAEHGGMPGAQRGLEGRDGAVEVSPVQQHITEKGRRPRPQRRVSFADDPVEQCLCFVVSLVPDQPVGQQVGRLRPGQQVRRFDQPGQHFHGTRCVDGHQALGLDDRCKVADLWRGTGDELVQ